MKCICCERNIIKPGDNPWLNGGTEEDYIWNTREYGGDENKDMKGPKIVCGMMV